MNRFNIFEKVFASNIKAITALHSRKKEKCPHNHFKKSCESGLDNMVQLIEFDPYKNKKRSYLPYTIYQCDHCGERAFGIVGYHLMSNKDSKMIDDFIQHEIKLQDLTDYFDRRGFRYKKNDEFIASKRYWNCRYWVEGIQ